MNDTATPIVVTDNTGAHRFQAVVDGHTAVALYQMEAGSIRFTHTVVPEELRGRGIANELVVRALADARRRGLKVTPQCPVFAAWMRRHADTHDLLTAEGRTMLALDAST
jgi:predicted GNAT family acetyltransferase